MPTTVLAPFAAQDSSRVVGDLNLLHERHTFLTDCSGRIGRRFTQPAKEGEQDEAMAERDVETITSPSEFVATLRRLADALESGTSFRIQIAGERFRVPKHAELSIEHERDGDGEEIELQMRWSPLSPTGDTDTEDVDV